MNRAARRTIHGALLIMTLAATLTAHGADNRSTPASQRARRNLLVATQTLHEGWASGDVASFASLLAPDYELTDSGGRVFDRASVLAGACRHDAGPETGSSELSELCVTLAAGAGLVTGIADDRLHYAEHEEHRRRRFTEVWIAAASGWQLLASHESAAEPTRAPPAPVSGQRLP